VSHFDLVVLGAGPGGYVAAIRASQLGLKVGVIEKQYWGGVCLNVGCIPSKALLRNAELAHILEHEKDKFGITGDATMDFKPTHARSREVSDSIVKGVHFLMKKNKVTEIHGWGTFKDAFRHLILPAHFIAVTLWVECYRLLPLVPRERRVVFTVGLGCGLVLVCLTATTVGYTLAANLPPTLAAAILLLTPLAFLLSTARNAKHLVDALALVLGLALYPLVAMLHTGVDILISGLSAGTIAFGVHWWRGRA